MIHIKEQTIGLNQYSELVAHFGLISEALSIFPWSKQRILSNCLTQTYIGMYKVYHCVRFSWNRMCTHG